ncbi:MAG: hypothetical protein JST21_06620, partial [Bacteroidetes bacterium]|nr:hypothetical protein [Bacteroidota bacterium]
DMDLSPGQVIMLTNWTNDGGVFIALKPDQKLNALLGVKVSTDKVLADKYLLVNTTSGPGVGIVNQTMQYHGPANLYSLNGATQLATLYSDAVTATAYPAITINGVGTKGGSAIAFSYDLAKSIIYTRQGNPAWAGMERDGQAGPIRSDDLYFGNKPGDSHADWVDLNKVAIPHADEQQRLLTNIILQYNLHRKPLPRFWFLPRRLKAAVVMTGDDHANNGTTDRFKHYLSISPSNTPEAVDDWTAIRGTSYLFHQTPMTNEQAVEFEKQGFEIGLHLNTECGNYTLASLKDSFTTQLSKFAARFPGISNPVTHRTHCIAWSDWVSKPKVELLKGIRLNTDYYYWPGAWVQDRPGMFTGSGMPMRFADLDGTIIDNYQVATQMTDESDITYSKHINLLLDNALGTEGYYGVFCANMHTDENGGNSSRGSDAIIEAAMAKKVPVISAKQMLTWLDGRNASSFGSIVWKNNELSFNITAGKGAKNLWAMLPYNTPAGSLVNLKRNGIPVPVEKETIKGITYIFFEAGNGNYVAQYR